MNIAVVVGDIGSANELVPVAVELKARGNNVCWYADAFGKAKSDVLEKKNIDYSLTLPVNEDFDAILCGASATAVETLGAFTHYGREKNIPVIWMEDLWGTGSREKTRGIFPNVMLVVDAIAARIAKTVRPALRTIVVGKPTFGELPGKEDLPGIRERVRNEMSFRQTDFLVTYGFGGEPPERALNQLEQVVNNSPFPKSATVAWRFHPKHPDALGMWERASKSGIRTVDARKFPLLDLYIASDVVIADWGVTDAYKTVLLGIPTITTLFPNDKEARVAVGYPNGTPPILIGQEKWGVGNTTELATMLSGVLCSGPSVSQRSKDARAEPFRELIRPGAAIRAADAVEKIVTNHCI